MSVFLSLNIYAENREIYILKIPQFKISNLFRISISISKYIFKYCSICGIKNSFTFLYIYTNLRKYFSYNPFNTFKR